MESESEGGITMKINVHDFERFYYSFDSSDEAEVQDMVRTLNDPMNDIRTYYTEDGNMILHWPLDGNDDDDNEYDEYLYIGIDFGPSNPWDAPGMSISDFIR